MTYINFLYWLQGFFEITGEKQLSDKQYQIICKHIVLVENTKEVIMFGNNSGPKYMDAFNTIKQNLTAGIVKSVIFETISNCLTNVTSSNNNLEDQFKYCTPNKNYSMSYGKKSDKNYNDSPYSIEAAFDTSYKSGNLSQTFLTTGPLIIC